MRACACIGVCMCSCLCVCVRACVCMCVCTVCMPEEGLWVNWCVAGMGPRGLRGPSPLSRTGRNPVARRELKLITRSGQVAERNPLRPEGDLAPLSGSVPSPSSDDFFSWSLTGLGGVGRRASRLLPRAHCWQPCGSLASWAAPQTSLCPSGERGQCCQPPSLLLPPPLAWP